MSDKGRLRFSREPLRTRFMPGHTKRRVWVGDTELPLILASSMAGYWAVVRHPCLTEELADSDRFEVMYRLPEITGHRIQSRGAIVEMMREKIALIPAETWGEILQTMKDNPDRFFGGWTTDATEETT